SGTRGTLSEETRQAAARVPVSKARYRGLSQNERSAGPAACRAFTSSMRVCPSTPCGVSAPTLQAICDNGNGPPRVKNPGCSTRCSLLFVPLVAGPTSRAAGKAPRCLRGTRPRARECPLCTAFQNFVEAQGAERRVRHQTETY